MCAAGDGCDEPYITVKLSEPENYTYLNLTVKKIEILDFLDSGIKVVAPNLNETYAPSKILHAPTVGKVNRIFTDEKGTYSNDGKSIYVEIACKEKSVNSLPGGYQNYPVFTEQTFPDFIFPDFSGAEGKGDAIGNVLLLKSPKEELGRDECFVDYIKEAFKEGYLLTRGAVIYYNSTGGGAIWFTDEVKYDKNNLTSTLLENEVDLKNFCPSLSAIKGVLA
ncbi:MAG: hypothetical protein RQM90_14475 [Methanoculleus sp.]